MAVDLRFKSMDDFHPEQVAEQVAAAAQSSSRPAGGSRTFCTKLDGNDKLDELLQDVISSTDSLTKLGKEAGVAKPEDEGK